MEPAPATMLPLAVFPRLCAGGMLPDHRKRKTH